MFVHSFLKGLEGVSATNMLPVTSKFPGLFVWILTVSALDGKGLYVIV